MISVKNLCKSFGELNVLNDITENIESGEKVAIIGPSGSGKSTFLRCLNLLEIPTSGEVWFEGKQINAFVGNEKLELTKERKAIVNALKEKNVKLKKSPDNVDLPSQINELEQNLLAVEDKLANAKLVKKTAQQQ
ncbi:MAG: ATP-binding cassette domain-containing protein, partial [Clostridia bacterium]